MNSKLVIQRNTPGVCGFKKPEFAFIEELSVIVQQDEKKDRRLEDVGGREEFVSLCLHKSCAKASNGVSLTSQYARNG